METLFQRKFLLCFNSFSLSPFSFTQPTLLGDFVSDSLSIHIVPPDSANPDIGHFVPVDTDHMNICKPRGRKDCYLYTMTRKFIEDCLEKRMIETALKMATSAVAVDADVGDDAAAVVGEDEYDLDCDIWQ